MNVITNYYSSYDSVAGIGGAQGYIYIDESYESLTWTERFQDFDTFEMVHPDPDWAAQRWPLQSWLAILESRVVMRVETHEITIDEDGTKKLKLSGRSLEAILDERDVLSDYTKTRTAGNYAWISRVAAPPRTQIAKVIAAQITAQVSAFINAGQYWSGYDICPDTMVSFLNAPVGTSQQWANPSIQSKWSYILPIMQAENYGLRIQRPIGVNAAEIIPSANWAGGAGALGGINNTRMEFQIIGPVARENSLIISVYEDHFVSERYLDTYQGAVNSVILDTDVDGIRASFADSNTEAHRYDAWGWNRRWGMYDFKGQQAPAATDAGSKAAVVDAFVRSVYGPNRHKLRFEGELSNLFPYRYGTDYDLGDTVRLRGRYGITAVAQVTEFTRIKENQSYTDFPTLSPTS